MNACPASPIRVGNRSLGFGQPVFLVAEIGINHNGDIDLARRTVDAAVAAGADGVKFQNYVTEDFVLDRGLTHTYLSQGRQVVESQFSLFKRCELSEEALERLKRHCDQIGTVFLSTPTSARGIDTLARLGVPLLKNGSDFLTHLPLIRAMARSGIPTILSTGMSTLIDIAEAVGAFREAGGRELILLHCTTSYPTAPENTHLRKLPSLAATFGCPVGFSDHTDGITAALGATVLGACLIEKHFTLDRNLPGPDHRFSSDPAEFAALAEGVRTLERQLGQPLLTPAASEGESRALYRLSCAASRDLPAGHRLSETDIVFLRPGTGIPPAQAAFLYGRRLVRRVTAHVPLVLGDID